MNAGDCIMNDAIDIDAGGSPTSLSPNPETALLVLHFSAPHKHKIRGVQCSALFNNESNHLLILVRC